MGKNKLKGKDLRKIGYESNTAKSIALNIMLQHYKYITKDEKLKILRNVKEHPEEYKDDEILSKLAAEFLDVVEHKNFTSYKLKPDEVPFKVFGKKFIDQNTIKQMDMAMRLPVAVNGALMPDAHVGYGLPIGGVLATENEIIPYGVGMDIGCRMSLSIYDVPAEFLNRNSYQLKTALKEETHFGIGRQQISSVEHAVLDRAEFRETELLRQLHGKAVKQIGTSGSGNHFVEFGLVELYDHNSLQIPSGTYVGLLAHSGSRGMGASIAQYYTKIAMDICRLPKGAQNLAWLDMNKAEGQEYWQAMNLAGDYAKACHDVIHKKLSKSLKLKPIAKIENHHNFAWKEIQLDGRELIVHRKGAIPAKEGELGIIPGSMTAPGFIVSGLGNVNSLNSASHGAGRKFSRKKTKESITGSAMKKMLKNAGVTLIGGGLDEAPIAYKDINQVIENQKDLIKVEGKFIPKIVRMDKG